MNRSLLLFALLALLLVHPSVAQEQPQAVVQTQVQAVSYQKRLPFAVRRKMPHAAKSRFFGSLRLTPDSNEVAVHLFSNHDKKVKPREGGMYYFTINLFEVSRVPGRKAASYHFVQQFQLYDWTGDYERFQVQFFYLDQKQKSTPCLMFNLFSVAYGKGSFGDKVVAVFTQGWTQQPTTQALYYDTTSSNINGVTDVHIANEADKDGLAQIAVSSVPPGGEGEAHYRWNGKHFE